MTHYMNPTIRTSGDATENRGTFAYTSVKGDFVATCRVTAASQKSVGARSERDCRRKLTADRKDLPFFPLCSSANPDLQKPAFLKKLLRNAPGIAYRYNTYLLIPL